MRGQAGLVRLLGLGLGAGLAAGLLAGTAIFLASRDPLTPKIIYAELVTGAVTGLLMIRVVWEGRGWARTLVAGAVLGGVIAMFLAAEAKMVPFVLQAGVLQGLLLAAVLKRWGQSRRLAKPGHSTEN